MSDKLTPAQRELLQLMAGYFGWGGLAADFGATEYEMEALFGHGLVMRRIEPQGITLWSITEAGMRAVEKKGKRVRG